MVFTSFSGCTLNSCTQSQTDRPEYSMPLAPFINSGRVIKTVASVGGSHLFIATNQLQKLHSKHCVKQQQTSHTENLLVMLVHSHSTEDAALHGLSATFSCLISPSVVDSTPNTLNELHLKSCQHWL